MTAELAAGFGVDPSIFDNKCEPSDATRNKFITIPKPMLDKPLNESILIMDRYCGTIAICTEHVGQAIRIAYNATTVIVADKNLMPCKFCETTTIMRASFWSVSGHPSMRRAIALCETILDAELLPGF